jgi:porin
MDGINDKKFRCMAFLCFVFVASIAFGSAQLSSAADEAQKAKSGYEDVPQFGGPSSVGVQLKENDQVVEEPLLRLPWIDKTLKPWFDWKGGVAKKTGLGFSLDYQALYQKASTSPGEDEAAGGIFRFYGSWTLLGREGGSTGSLVFKVENRHDLGTDIVPQNLGFETGYLGIPGTMFSAYARDGWGLTNLYWQQKFWDGKLNFLLGQVDATDYLDIYGLINPLTAFGNLSFSTNPTIAAPNQGFGAALGVMATDNVYVIAGIADANGDPTEPDKSAESFFEDNEYFTHAEIGWVSSFERRYFDNVHLTYWHVDEREEAGVPDGWGLAFSATKFIDDKWMPFFRAGWSDGEAPLLNGMVSIGVGRYFSKRNDLVGLGVSWGEPAPDDLDDQWTSELFYRLQVAQNLALTPSVQWVANPALNPEEDSLFFFGIRGRLTF